MDGQARWVAEGMPPTDPGTCRLHHVPENVMAGGHLSQAGQEHFPCPVCPRCGFEDAYDMLTALWAVHDGTTWRTDDIYCRFQHAWLDHTRAEGHEIGELPHDLDPDVEHEPDSSGRWPILWAFRVLNPGVTQEEAQRLYSSTSIHRRRGYGNDDLAPFPYTDLTALRALSSGVLGRWETYHAALWAELDLQDQARVLEVDWNALHDGSEYVPSNGSDRTPFDLMLKFSPAVADYVERVVAAHRRVLASGVTQPTSNDRFQCNGDVYGDLGTDVPLGLRRWRLGPR